MFCEKCGIEVAEGLKFCPNCGAEIAVNAASTVNGANPVNPTNPVNGTNQISGVKTPNSAVASFGNKTNVIANFIQITAAVLIILGLIGAIVFACGENPFTREAYGIGGFFILAIPSVISCALMYGFGEIIELLQNIKDQNKK